MIKLNLTKEQVESMDLDLIVIDWKLMCAELDRLNKAIREAVGEITQYGKTYKDDDQDVGIVTGLYLNIIHKYFPELKEDIEDEDLLEEEDLQIEERERREQEGG